MYSNTDFYFRSEYFLTDYMYKIGNFSMSHQKTAFSVEGYYDAINFSAADLKASSNFSDARKLCKKQRGSNYVWEFVICPSVGFLGSPEPLTKDCELKISFDRALPFTSVLKTGASEDLTTPITIKDVVATTEYISSPHWREYFSEIDHPLDARIRRVKLPPIQTEWFIVTFFHRWPLCT